MKITPVYFTIALVALVSCSKTDRSDKDMNEVKAAPVDTLAFKSGYSDVNGINMYYETYLSAGQAGDEGKPLVLIHGGGSTIQSNFGKVIPLFTQNRKVIAVELQAHGRTSDRNADSSFEQDADDVVTLLKNLNIDKADIFGFSNGGTTALQIAIRHPEVVDRIIIGSALAKRSGAPVQLWEFMKQAHLDNMPAQLKEAYLKVSPSQEGLQVMHDRDAKRMLEFKDIPDEKIKSIKAPTLIIIGDKDVTTPEHALEMHRLISNSELAIIPGGHGDYIGEVTTLKPDSKASDYVAVPIIEIFLEKKQP